MQILNPSNLKPGDLVKCRHHRKGSFNMIFQSYREPWIQGSIHSGNARAMMAYNEKEAGDEITVRDSLCDLLPYGGE